MSQRTERIDELLRQEIGEILRRDVDDPRIGFVTITDVETAPDLRHAKVWVSVIGRPGERDQTLAALRRAMPFVRRQLGTRLRLRRIPELQVKPDESVERGTRVLHLLQQLEEGAVPDEPTPEGESLPTPVARLPHEGDAAEPVDAQEPGAQKLDAAAGPPKARERRRAPRRSRKMPP